MEGRKMAKYVDGFVLVVKKGKLKEYEKMAKLGGKMWMKHGALQYFECKGDDLNPNMGGVKILTFPKMTKLNPGETAIFSFIVYNSRKHRDSVNKKVMNDPAMNDPKYKNMPFDMKKMCYGGFSAIVNL